MSEPAWNELRREKNVADEVKQEAGSPRFDRIGFRAPGVASPDLRDETRKRKVKLGASLNALFHRTKEGE